VISREFGQLQGGFARQRALGPAPDEIEQALLAASPEFQTEHGYPASKPGKGNLTMCANYVAETFGCLSLTLEMPFKDNADRPDPDSVHRRYSHLTQKIPDQIFLRA